MCGIAGIHRLDDAPVDEKRLVAMRDNQAHRGPDAQGVHVAPRIGLAFNRLAIIDLSPAANQPMSGEAGATIVFNGEIYNFQDLRRELEARGRRFRTRSDTEVILQGYAEWGLEVVPRLNGMFAFALWDGDRRALHLVRDRVGKKPLYYRAEDGEVVFASEVRALVAGLAGTPEVDPRALDAYLSYLCVPGEMSIFAGVRKVPPASIVTWAAGECEVRRYWKISYHDKIADDEEEALARLGALLSDATRIRMISDVPVGAFLSGGVDSSTVVALMSRAAARVRTFSIGFADPEHDERRYARAVAATCGTDHSEHVVEPDAAAVLPRLVWHYGEPFADSSAVPTYYVCAAARQEVTVAVNGDGGDEAFAGYAWQRAAAMADVYRATLPPALRSRLGAVGGWLGRLPAAPRSLAAVGRLLREQSDGTGADPFWIWPGFRAADKPALYTPAFRARLGGHDAEERCRAVRRASDGATAFDRGMQVGLETYLPDDLLVKVDIASMACSLEARSPLLDYRVLEFCARLPRSLLLGPLRSKHLLKKFAARMVPEWTVYRKKRGFSVPLAAWLRGPLRRPVKALLESPRCAARGYFQAGEVRRLLARHQAGADCGPQIWALLWLELWFRMFVDGDLRPGDNLHDLG